MFDLISLLNVKGDMLCITKIYTVTNYFIEGLNAEVDVSCMYQTIITDKHIFTDFINTERYRHILDISSDISKRSYNIIHRKMSSAIRSVYNNSTNEVIGRKSYFVETIEIIKK